MIRSLLVRVGTSVLVLVVVALIVGQLLGQPILLGYVATGSMEPEMDAGDGFVAIPSAVSGSPSEGDVVVFQARELHGGELTTHRIVGETDEGYITKGDANPFTDQDGDEPPVTEGQIVATAWQVNGQVVTIPHLGTALMTFQNLAESVSSSVGGAVGATSTPDGESLGALVVGVGVALFGFGLLLDRTGVAARGTSRTRSRQNVLAFVTVVGLLLLLVVTFATAAMVVPSGTHEYEVRATESPSENPQIVEPGTTVELTRTVENAGFVPVVVAHDVQSDGVAIQPPDQTVGIRSEGETTITILTPDETGEYAYTIGEHRYLMVLPPSLLVALHDLHPLVAIGAVNAVLVGVVVSVFLLLFGSGDFRLRRPGGNVPLSTRLARKFR
ncbi:signal peptidase I [Halobacteria archaeon AArc-dxtr1]|nr:signal peptidase I [Halobacteria archaeon AArc-dxtr1]